MTENVAEIGIGVDTYGIVKGKNDLKEFARESIAAYKASKELSVGAERLNNYFNTMESQITKVNGNMRRATALFQQSGKGLRNFEVQVQQAGYQVGDFAVQVMSGTNPLVAFGQQASQLAGFFGGPWGAAIGAGIAILSALGGALLTASADAKAASEGLKIYEEAVKSVTESNKNLMLTIEGLRFGSTSEAETRALVEKAALEEQIKQLKLETLSAQSNLNSASGEAAVGAAAELGYVQSTYSTAVARLKAIEKELALNKTLEASLKKMEGSAKAFFTILTNVSKIDISHVFSNASGPANRLLGTVGALYAKALAMANFAQNYAPTGDGGYVDKSKLYANMGGRGVPSTKDNYALPENWKSEYNKAHREKTGGAGGGGNARLETLLASLGTEKEQLDAWYQQSQDDLQAASDKELEIVGGREEAKHRLIMEYQQKQYDAQQAQTQLLFQSQSGMYSALGDLLGQFAGKSKGAAVAALAIQKGLAIAQIVTSTAAAQMRAYAELGPIAGAAMAAKIGLLGKLQMGLVAATGLAQAGSIMGGGSSGGGSSRNTPTASISNNTAAPTTVMIQGMKPTDIFTGEQLSTLFDSLYKENNNRGMVFMVQR